MNSFSITTIIFLRATNLVALRRPSSRPFTSAPAVVVSTEGIDF